MSTMRADNYANRAGTSQVPATTVLQGTFKAWANVDGTGVISFRNSFNGSSLTDLFTGQYNVAFAAVMPNLVSASFGSCAQFGFGRAYASPVCNQLTFMTNQTAEASAPNTLADVNNTSVSVVNGTP